MESEKYSHGHITLQQCWKNRHTHTHTHPAEADSPWKWGSSFFKEYHMLVHTLQEPWAMCPHDCVFCKICRLRLLCLFHYLFPLWLAFCHIFLLSGAKETFGIWLRWRQGGKYLLWIYWGIFRWLSAMSKSKLFIAIHATLASRKKSIVCCLFHCWDRDMQDQRCYYDKNVI